MKTILEVRNLAKKYRIRHSQGGYLSLRERLLNSFNFKKVQKEDFWALRNISFDVQAGESIGIIGRNGAGKSTLLKVLSKITPPTIGRIITRGRIASLLEVGTGFHPELTGHENVFFNGSLLGMKRKEIERKFDEIIDFSGVEKFLDTPLKHYSSGMQLRLAFAVAAFLEPEILIIDEVLAVGDSEFQKKCIGKMEAVSKNEGRTILFVSHNLAAVSKLCTRGILLRSGEIVADDEVDKTIHKYIAFNQEHSEVGQLSNLDLRKGNGLIRIEQITMLNNLNQPITIASTGSDITFKIFFNKKVTHDNTFRIDFAIDNEQDFRIGWYSTSVVKTGWKREFQTLELKIAKFPFGAGRYYLTFYSTLRGEVVDYIHQAYSFDVEEGDFFGTGKVIPQTQTFFYSQHTIEVQ